MSNIDYIVNLCFDISEQGKKPSIALVRNMSQHPLGIPEIVKGIQRWKSAPTQRPNIHKKQVSTASETNEALQKRIILLENQVASIMQQLAKLTLDK